MKISVHVKAGSRTESIEKMDEGVYIVKVRTPPVEGRANERVRELLAKYLGISKSSLVIVSGLKNKKKIFQLVD